MSTAAGVPARPEAGRPGPAAWPGRAAGRLATLAVVIWYAFAPLLRRVPAPGLRAAVFAALFAVCAQEFPPRRAGPPMLA